MKVSSHHSTVWRWGETTVNREKAAAHQNLQKKTHKSEVGASNLWSDKAADGFTTQFHLNQLFSAVKLWHQNVLPISHSGEGHAELSGCPKVGVFWKLLHQAHPYHLQHIEAWVENSQGVLSGLSRHFQHFITELLCEKMQQTSLFRESYSHIYYSGMWELIKSINHMI